jgi:hypothetical protein
MWSGGRFMHFGEPLEDDRFVAAIRLAYERGIRTFVTADVYGAGEADKLLGERSKEFLATATVWWVPLVMIFIKASATARKDSRVLPIALCGNRATMQAICARPRKNRWPAVMLIDSICSSCTIPTPLVTRPMPSGREWPS